MKVVRMGHHIEICSEMDKLNHLVKAMRTNKRCYFKPESIFIRCMDECSLLGMTVGKNDPRHGGEDNLAKKIFFGMMSLKTLGVKIKSK